MLVSPLVSAIGSSFGSVHPAVGAVPRTRMIIDSGASCGRLSITLSTEVIGSSVEGGIGGGPAGAGGGAAVSAVVAGGASCVWLSGALRLQATSSRVSATTTVPVCANFIGPFLREYRSAIHKKAPRPNQPIGPRALQAAVRSDQGVGAGAGAGSAGGGSGG